MASFSSSFSNSVSSFSCSCHCHSESPSPPPAWSDTATKSIVPVKKPITSPSAVSRASSPLSFAAGGASVVPITPPKKTEPINVPPAPKKDPKQILREAIKRMNEAHPEQNIMNILHPMAYGTPYPGYRDEDFDENEPLDEEELSEEEIEDIIERSRDGWRERKSNYRF